MEYRAIDSPCEGSDQIPSGCCNTTRFQLVGFISLCLFEATTLVLRLCVTLRTLLGQSESSVVLTFNQLKSGQESRVVTGLICPEN